MDAQWAIQEAQAQMQEAQERMDAQWAIQEEQAQIVEARRTAIGTTQTGRAGVSVRTPARARAALPALGSRPVPLPVSPRVTEPLPDRDLLIPAQTQEPAGQVLPVSQEPDVWHEIPLSSPRGAVAERQFTVRPQDPSAARVQGHALASGAGASPSSDESGGWSRIAEASLRWDPLGRAAPRPPLTPLVPLRTQLRNGLDGLPYSARALEQVAEQEGLKELYLDRAVQIAERRKTAFGPTQRYQVGAPMTTQTKEGSLAAAYEGLQSFVTSAFRSPSGSATGLSVKLKGTVFLIDQALITALVQGALAYAAEGAMVAMKNRAKLSNMPEIARNKFEDLFYEHGVQADTVLLVVKNGTKEFMRANDPRAPTPEALAEQATRKLSAIKLRQDLLDGKSFAFPLVPLMSGGFNTLRRFISSAKTLGTPLPLFVTSALASGSASGVTKLALELAKTRAQVEIDDLMGGRQAVNLFRLSRPRPEAEPVRWSDAGRLLGFLGESARESLALAGEAARTFAHSAADMGYRYILVNGIANVGGLGFGGLMGQVFRKDRHFGALPGESPHSRANIAGQMVQSTFGDAFWRGMKEVMKGRELDGNASLSLRRTTGMAEQLREAERERDVLLDLLALGGQEFAAVDIEAHGQLLNWFGRAGPMELDAWQFDRDEIAAVDLSDATAPQQSRRDAVLRQIDKVIGPLARHDATEQWLRPRD